jgi:pimeloyl-ACP methyl ester carboxylesterase
MDFKEVSDYSPSINTNSLNILTENTGFKSSSNFPVASDSEKVPEILPKDGDLVKDSGGKVYQIEAGKKRLIPNPGIFQAMGFKNEQIKTLSDEELNKIIPGDKLPIPSNYIQAPQTSEWYGKFYSWDGDIAPPLNFSDNTDNQFAALSLAEDANGIKFDWGNSSFNNDTGLLSDYFAIAADKEVTFSNGTYTFSASGDDGFRILARNIDSGEQINITPENQWTYNRRSRRRRQAAFQTEVKLNGKYELSFNFYERNENARFDLTWEQKATPADPNKTLNNAVSLGEFLDSKQEKRSDSVGGLNNTSDFWRFNLKNARTNVDISLIDGRNEINLQLIQDKNNNGSIDNEEEIISQSLPSGTSGRFIAQILNAGEYFIRAFPKNEAITTPYELELRSTLLSKDFVEFASFKGPTNIWRYDEGGRTEREKVQGGTSQGIKSGKETILVIHGWNNNDEVDTVRELAKEASEYPDSQVLSLDWSSVAQAGLDDGIVPYKTAGWIFSVAKWTHDRLVQLGIDSQELSIVGHSLGTYIGTEIGKLFGKVKNFVALDPAFPADGLIGYDIDNQRDGKQGPPNFKDIANNSLAFVVADGWLGIPGINIGTAGDNDKAGTANSSFLIKFEGKDGFSAYDAHGAVVDVFTKALDKRLINFTSPNFNLPSFRNNWYDNNGDKDNFLDRLFNNGNHEGIISAKWTGKNLSWNDAPNKVWNKDSDIYNPWDIKGLKRVVNSSGDEKYTWQ